MALSCTIGSIQGDSVVLSVANRSGKDRVVILVEGRSLAGSNGAGAR